MTCAKTIPPADLIEIADGAGDIAQAEAAPNGLDICTAATSQCVCSMSLNVNPRPPPAIAPNGSTPAPRLTCAMSSVPGARDTAPEIPRLARGRYRRRDNAGRVASVGGSRVESRLGSPAPAGERQQMDREDAALMHRHRRGVRAGAIDSAGLEPVSPETPPSAVVRRVSAPFCVDRIHVGSAVAVGDEVERAAVPGPLRRDVLRW